MDPETPKIDSSKANPLPGNASEEIRNLDAGLQKILYGQKQVQNTPTNTTASSQEPDSNISSDQTQNLDASLQKVIYGQKQVQNIPSTTASSQEPDSNISSDETQNLNAGLQKILYSQKQVQNIPMNVVSSSQEPEKNISTPDLDVEVQEILFGKKQDSNTPSSTTSSSQDPGPSIFRNQYSSFSEPDQNININQQSLVWKRNNYWELGPLRKPFTICRVYLADVDLDQVRESLEEKVRNQGNNLHDDSSKASYMNSSFLSNEDKKNDERSSGKASSIGKPKKISDFNLTQLRDELKDLDAKPEGRQ